MHVPRAEQLPIGYRQASPIEQSESCEQALPEHPWATTVATSMARMAATRRLIAASRLHSRFTRRYTFRVMSVGRHLVILSLGCAACVTPPPALMTPVASLDTRAPSDAARVVFVREASACDGGAPFRIVDGGLKFIGDSPPASKFTVLVPASHHAFFAWQPSGDVPPDLYPWANQVGRLEGDFAAGRTYYVAVSIENGPFALRKTCDKYQWLALRMVDPADAEVAHVIAGAHAWVPDVPAGQRAVDSDRTETARHVALGMQALRSPAEVGPPEEPITWPSWMP